MRRQGVRRLIAFCLNDACRHQALIEVWSYPPETEIAYFKRRVICAKCGARGNNIWQTRIIVVPLNIGWFRSTSRGR